MPHLQACVPGQFPREQPAVFAIHTIDHGRLQSFQHRRPHALECTATVRDIADIATFKRQLKTHLFVKHYGP